MVLEGSSVHVGGAQSDALVTSLLLLALLCFASYAKACRRSKTRAYLFSVCSARLLSVPLVGYRVRRYDATTTFNLVRIQDCNASALLEARGANDLTFCCPLLSPSSAWSNFFIIFASLTVERRLSETEESRAGKFHRGTGLRTGNFACGHSISALRLLLGRNPSSAWSGFRRIDRFATIGSEPSPSDEACIYSTRSMMI